MNSYLITDMPGTFRFTCVDRAISFYSELCTELLAFARDGDDGDIESNLTDDEVHVLRSFSQAFTNFDASVPTTEINKRSLLHGWKTLLNQLLVFYANSNFRNTEAADISKWRWFKVRERAEKWQKKADTHDWSDSLKIEPNLWSEPWWHGGARHWGVPEAERFF